MPWVPELFSAPELQRFLDKRRRAELVSVPFFDGLLADEPRALVDSFAGEPEVHHPVRGRIKGAPAFEAFITDMTDWLRRRNCSVEDVERVIHERRGFEEVVLHLDGGVDVPVGIVADRWPDGRIEELRIYHSSRPLTGRHANRPPVLQPRPELHESGVLADYHRALETGDVDGVVAAFEPDGYARESAGVAHVHSGHDALRAYFARMFSNGGGVPLEHCALVDDERACALEYNVVRWGRTELPPQAGLAVHVRGPSGRLAAVRMYDDVDPPLD